MAANRQSDRLMQRRDDRRDSTRYSLPQAPARILWDRACSRRRCVCHHWCWMCRPLREQARSHSVLCWPWMLWTTQVLCGSWPASDGGVSATMDVGCAGLIASRL